jgi:DNA-binding XRE family transcriptional regulator
MKTSQYKQIRQFLGFKQDDVAKICGVSKKTVARFEAGTSSNLKLQKWYTEAKTQLILKLH